MPGTPLARLIRWLHHGEDAALALILTAMILLAAGQILLRNVFGASITWTDPLLRVMVLWLGLLGALAATRDGKHISIDALLRVTPQRLRCAVQAFTALFTATVAGILAYHSARFVLFDYEAGVMAFAGVPAWVTELILPFAFGMIALRFALTGAGHVLRCTLGERRAPGDNAS